MKKNVTAKGKGKGKGFIGILVVVLLLEVVAVGGIDYLQTQHREKAPMLRIHSACWQREEELSDDDYGEILVIIENYGGTTTRYLPPLCYGTGSDVETYVEYIQPDSYYDAINMKNATTYTENQLIPPGAVVGVVYEVSAQDALHLEGYRMEETGMGVALPESWAQERTVCELEIVIR